MRHSAWHGALVLLGSLAMAGYFGHHAVSGTHGVEARKRLLERSARIEQDVGALDAVRARLRRDVDLLAKEPPARDLVEEIARETLGLLYPGEQKIE